MKLAGTYGPGVRLLGNVSLAAVLFYGGLRVIAYEDLILDEPEPRAVQRIAAVRPTPPVF